MLSLLDYGACFAFIDNLCNSVNGQFHLSITSCSLHHLLYVLMCHVPTEL